ncbi:hypothetical protein D3C76_1261740 [compost metagenome]
MEVRLKPRLVTMLTPAAIAVVINRMAIMETLILPRFCLPFRFIMAEMIDTMINGITTICNKRTYPEPTRLNQSTDFVTTSEPDVYTN